MTLQLVMVLIFLRKNYLIFIFIYLFIYLAEAPGVVIFLKGNISSKSPRASTVMHVFLFFFFFNYYYLKVTVRETVCFLIGHLFN